jgi:hypothetical protein
LVVRPAARSAKNAVAGLYDGLLGLFGKQGGARMSAAEQTAVAAVRRSMERSQLNPQQILDAVREFEGKPAVLAEVIGQDAVNALTSLTRRPGSTPQKAQAIIEDRYGGFVDRAQDDLERATGVGRGQAPEQFKRLVEEQQQVARPLYNRLGRDFADINSDRLDEIGRASPVSPMVSAKKPTGTPDQMSDLPADMSPELEAWVQSLLDVPKGSELKPLSGSAVREVRDLAIAQGRDPQSVSRMDVYDHVKRKLDDKIQAARKNDNHTDLNRYTQLRDALVDELDALTGGQYKAARDAGMGPRLRAAQSQGGRILNSNVRGADVAQTAASSPQEARALQLGAVDTLSTKIDNNTTPNRLARVPANREKITTALGEDAGGQFVGKMEAEAKLRDTGSRWAPRMNSVTGTVLEGGPSQAVDDAIMMGAAAARGDKVSLITNAVRFMRRRGYNQREIDAMGDLLLSNPMEGLKRLGVRLPSGGNGGAPANVFANGGQNVQQSTQQPVNAFSPVKSAGVAGLRSDAGAAAVGGAVGGFAPAESTEDRLRNVFAGAAIATTGGRLDRVLPKRGGGAAARTANDLPFNEGQTFYHATNAPEFSQFKVNPKGHNRLGKGVYLTSSQDDARGFLKDGRVVETHIRGDVFDAKRGSDEMAQEVAQRTGIDPQKVAKTILRPDGRYSGSDKATELLKRAGFSGVTDTDGHFPSQVMIFDPADVQIKGQGGVASAGFGGGKLPKLRKDVPTGTPKQAGQSRMSGSIQRGLEESSSMGAAKATGDKAVRQKTAMSEANRMAEAGRNYVDVFDKTGVVLIPYKGGTIKYYAPGADHPDTVIRTFISDLNKPLEKRQPMTNSILSAIGEQEKPLMLGRANTPMIEGTGRTPENVFARKQ